MGHGRMRAWVALGMATIVFAALAACHDRTTISGPQIVQFSLDSIDGHPLPYQVSQSPDGSVTTVVTDMVLSISEDASWHTLGHQTVTTNGVPSQQVLQGSGTFAVFDPNATFRDTQGNIVWAGEVTNGDFRLKNAQGQEYYFARKR